MDFGVRLAPVYPTPGSVTAKVTVRMDQMRRPITAVSRLSQFNFDEIIKNTQHQKEKKYIHDKIY